jgi:dipeptidyl aminopeptidase/acylaminoacyl peptidase
MPWQAPEAWIRQSPFFRVENVKTPVLVMCGIDDVRTPVSQSEQWFTALRRAGKEATLVLYPSERHAAFGEAGEVDQWERTLAWLAK